MNQTAAIISLVVIALVTALVVVGAYWYFGNIKAENTFCTNWYNNIEDRKIQLDNELYQYENAGFWESLDFNVDQYNLEVSQLNAEVAEYNKECAY